MEEAPATGVGAWGECVSLCSCVYKSPEFVIGGIRKGR